LHLRHERCRRRDVESLAPVVDGRRRQAGLDQLDAPTVDDLVLGECRHRDRLAQMIRDSSTHPDNRRVAGPAMG
jgi:hypothetical protein